VSRPAPPAVLLDAFGTLVGLDPPVPRLRRRLADEGYEFPDAVVAEALLAEMRFYRERHDDGRDAASLADLRRRCASVLGDGLGRPRPSLDLLTECLLDSLEFVLLPDVLPALDMLRDRGHPLAVVSNWDYELPCELERLGVADRFEAIAVSATLGAGKPDPAIFRWALDRLGVSPEAAVHCGDHPDKDCLGAQSAGIRAVLLDREGRFPDATCPRIGALTELPAVLERTWIVTA
jgi:putative hydrolase of the HAD superfamily